MGILDEIFGGNDSTTLGNTDIASDMLKDSKFAVTSLAMAITEVTNPEVRKILARQLTTAVEMHQRLSDLLVHKEWFRPYLSPQEQLGQDVEMSRNSI